MSKIGRNTNTNDTATVTTYVVSTTAVVISPANPKRIHFSACLQHGATDEDVAIRCYPASTDNTPKGEMLTRRTASNDALFRPSWSTPTDNLYTGEISAVTPSGTTTIHVTEW